MKNRKNIIIFSTILIMLILIIICIVRINNKKEDKTENKIDTETSKENVVDEVKNTVGKDWDKEENNTEVIIIDEEKRVLPETYEGFNVVGTIKIPKTGVDLYVFDKQTVKGMEIAACILYSTSDLNKIGNTVITGHNYQNGKLFSNNGDLEVGDKIYITDAMGDEKIYTVYSTFMTTPEDASFYNRETSVPEITLSTCSDDEESRIITLAKCEE